MTYELDIDLIHGPSMIIEPHIYYQIDCEEYALETHLGRISTQGILIGEGNDREFIPGHRIHSIKDRTVEKTDVSDSIKNALTQEDDTIHNSTR